MFSKLAAFLFLAVISSSCWASASAQAPAGWQTYRSPGYGFAIAYPPEMHVYNSARGENAGNNGPDCAATTIACFVYTG